MQHDLRLITVFVCTGFSTVSLFITIVMWKLNILPDLWDLLKSCMHFNVGKTETTFHYELWDNITSSYMVPAFSLCQFYTVSGAAMTHCFGLHIFTSLVACCYVNLTSCLPIFLNDLNHILKIIGSTSSAASSLYPCCTLNCLWN